VDLGLAKDYAKSQGIQVVTHSDSWFNSSRGDGSGGPGTPDAIVADAVASGILWVNSAGNRANQHWSGTFSDTDGDDVHNFTPDQEGNTIPISAGKEVCAALKWDDWPTSSQDFDLFLLPQGGSQPVAGSTKDQTGTQQPTEGFCYTNSGSTGNFF